MISIHRRTLFLFAVSFLALVGSAIQSEAQSSSLLADGVQDFVKQEQLLGKVAIKSSLMLGSFSSGYRAFDSLVPAWRPNNSGNREFRHSSRFHIEMLPVSSEFQYNSHHPYGGNDGSMIPAAGLQMLVSTGLFLQAGDFSVQLKPEFVSAQNKNFETFPTEQYDVFWEKYYQFLNKIDMPEQYGKTSYQQVFPGQSSIRYTRGSFSAGISTENLWWGPGRFNALVMSNNAPGFAHVTVNTVKPIETSIGTFEAQLIAGSLTSSGIPLADTNRYFNNMRLYQRKRDESRYIAGFILSWHPSWIKGLHIGFTSASYLYNSDIAGLADILPLGGIIVSASEKADKKASLGSVFARYVMPEEHAELYFEFGRNDKSPTLINLVSDHHYPRAYVAGFRKLFTSRHSHYIEFSSEFTQMQVPVADLIEPVSSWYTHPSVRHGFTNKGQVLGASIGPGSNSQLVDISWVKGFNKVGVRFERIARNNDFFYNAFVITHDYTRHWIDLSTTLHGDWQYKQFIFSSQLALVRSLNYEWYIIPGLRYFENGYDFLNLHARLAISYRL